MDKVTPYMFVLVVGILSSQLRQRESFLWKCLAAVGGGEGAAEVTFQPMPTSRVKPLRVMLDTGLYKRNSGGLVG